MKCSKKTWSERKDTVLKTVSFFLKTELPLSCLGHKIGRDKYKAAVWRLYGKPVVRFRMLRTGCVMFCLDQTSHLLSGKDWRIARKAYSLLTS